MDIVVSTVAELAGGWLWWQTTVATTAFIFVIRLPGIITAFAGYRKVSLDAARKLRILEMKLEKRTRKTEGRSYKPPSSNKSDHK